MKRENKIKSTINDLDKQLLKHCGPWERPWSASWDRSPACGTAIEAQIVFETLLVLVAGQLAIAGQLGREIHPRSIGLLLGSGEQRWLGEGVLGR